MKHPELHRQLIALGVEIRVSVRAIEVVALRRADGMLLALTEVFSGSSPEAVEAACARIAEAAWIALMTQAQGCGA